MYLLQRKKGEKDRGTMAVYGCWLAGNDDGMMMAGGRVGGCLGGLGVQQSSFNSVGNFSRIFHNNSIRFIVCSHFICCICSCCHSLTLSLSPPLSPLFPLSRSPSLSFITLGNLLSFILCPFLFARPHISR